MISDFCVSVEAGPCVDIELPISGVKYMGDVVSLECPLVFGCIPKDKKHHYASMQMSERGVYHIYEHTAW